MRHLDEEDLILHHFGESGDPDGAARHLAGCPACRARLADLVSLLALTDLPSPPVRGEDYGAGVWERIRHQLPEPRTWMDIFTVRPPAWALCGVVAILVAGAFMLGRYWREPAPAETLTTSGSARVRILLVSVADHLERSQRLLMEVGNNPGPDAAGVARQQGRAEELVGANRLFRLAAESAGENTVASILDDLEAVLLEVAHEPVTPDPEAFASLRRRIADREILFKIRIAGFHVREREGALLRALARTTS
jgi:hypothetical protein